MYCEKCGMFLPDDAARCEYCGASVERKQKKKNSRGMIAALLAVLVAGLITVGWRMFPDIARPAEAPTELSTAYRLIEERRTMADGTSYLLSKVEYRDDGQEAGSVEYRPDGSRKSECTHTYNEEGRLTESKTISFHENTGTVWCEKTSYYDPAGHGEKTQTIESWFTEAGALDFSYTYFYAPDGLYRAACYKYYDTEGALSGTRDIEYDRNGEVQRKKYQSYHGGVLGEDFSDEIFENQYDDKGNLICSERIEYIENHKRVGGIEKETREYEYDAEGRILSQTSFNAYSDSTWTSKTLNRYDEQGNLTEYQFIRDPQYQYDDGHVFKSLYTYSQDGRIIAHDHYVDDAFDFHEDYIYEEYDPNGPASNQTATEAEESPSSESGLLGGNLKWTLYADGLLVISGRGKMDSLDDLPESAQEEVKRIRLEEGVTSIPDYAFENWHFTEIEIPDSVQYIGCSAFSGCIGLRSVCIPQGVCWIGDNTFARCESLQSVSLSVSLDYIGDWAFQDCISLETLTIPPYVSGIGHGAFSECDSLKEIAIPDLVNSIWPGTFSYCSSLEHVKLPENLRMIDESAFLCCYALSNIAIPKSVTRIGEAAFYGCGSLKSVKVVRNCAIEEGAFDPGTKIEFY